MNKRKVKPENIRRAEIMNATYDVIYAVGLSNTTIALIAKKAKLSVGIISHYFGDKQGLINACMLNFLKILWQTITQYKADVSDKHPKFMLRAIIDANFDISQTNPKSMRIWLDFWSASLHIPELSRLQHINDQRLYSNLKHHFLEIMPKEQAGLSAQGLAAMIDGLWLRGSLSREPQFNTELARTIAYTYLDDQLKQLDSART